MNFVPLTKSIKFLLFSLGHYTRRLRRGKFPGVLVLCYHGIRQDDWPAGSMPFEELHVRASELDAHCRLLKQTCHPISLDDWRQSLTGRRALPERPVLLTFDDGYRTVYTLAQPILKKYGVPATIFVCSEPVEKRQTFWYNGIARADGEARVEEHKSAPFDQWQAICASASSPIEDDDPLAPLTVEEVRGLAETPGIEIGGHSASHLILARADLARQREEITRNKTMLEAWTGRRVSAFAYPNGRPELDYTAETVELIKDAGFEFGFTTQYGFATPDESLFESSRYMMLSGVSASELAHRLCYTW